MNSDSENSTSLHTSPTDEDDDDDDDVNMVQLVSNAEYQRRMFNTLENSLSSRSSSWSSSPSLVEDEENIEEEEEESWETDDDSDFQSYYFQGNFEDKVYVNQDRDIQEIIVSKYGGFFDLDGVWSSSVLHNLHIKLKDIPEYQKIRLREIALVEAACITARTDVFDCDHKNRMMLKLECLLSHHDFVKWREEIVEQEKNKKKETGTQTSMDCVYEDKEEPSMPNTIEKDKEILEKWRQDEEKEEIQKEEEEKQEECIHSRTIISQDSRYEKLLKENFGSRNWSKNALKYKGRKIIDDIFESL